MVVQQGDYQSHSLLIVLSSNISSRYTVIVVECKIRECEYCTIHNVDICDTTNGKEQFLSSHNHDKVFPEISFLGFSN